jgi:hypothetical protein
MIIYVFKIKINIFKYFKVYIHIIFEKNNVYKSTLKFYYLIKYIMNFLQIKFQPLIIYSY